MEDKNLFIFAIGGTGSRVLKSLIFLLASGVKIPNVKNIIPIIIDPDIQNGDLARTVELIKNYNRIRKIGNSEKTQFFYHPITALKDLEGKEAGSQFIFDIGKIRNKKFKEFIELESLSRENQALSRMIFSEKNLDLDMEVGFKGNPNIGSIVLNQMKNEEFFTDFANRITAKDRIFIISSIFGGTGASGFPILLKNLRYPEDRFTNKQTLKDSKIGAISILPYFKVDNPNGDIDSGTFISKSIAALKYYSSNIFDANLLNAFYCIGDDQQNMQTGADGKAEQKNKAHFVEIAAALAIHHFMSLSDEELNGDHFEFGIEPPQNEIVNFTTLSRLTRKIIEEPLTQKFLFYQYFMDIYPKIKDDKKIPHIHSKDHPLTEQNLSSIKMELEKFMNAFWEWLQENKDSKISFEPFCLEKMDSKLMYSCVKGLDRKTSKGFFGLGSTNDYNNFMDTLNQFHEEFKSLVPEKKLLALLWKVTSQIVKKEIFKSN